MKTEVINLTSEYTYIRCDSEFTMLMTNGSTVSMWRGFYCFKTDQLGEYNTNGQMIIQTDDNAELWWLCTNTLIMGVTDINNQTLSYIGQINSQNALANIQALDYYNRSENLLQSIQNTLSIFINAYVSANSVEDFGFISGTINNNLQVDVFIAKAAKYTFNCSISFTNSANVSVPSSISGMYGGGTVNLTLFNISFTNPSNGTIQNTISLKNSIVGFNLYDNTNTLQNGYTVSNTSVLSSVKISSGALMRIKIFSEVYANIGSASEVSYDNTHLDISAIYNNNFVLSMSSKTATIATSNQSATSIVTEKLILNFDVAKT